MLFKLILKTNLVTWLALIMSNTVLAVVMSLNIGLIVAGVRSTGETQEAYISLGSTALLLVVATSLVSLTLVTNFTLRLQHPVVARWQLVGMLPGQAARILRAQVLVVSTLTGVIGAAFAWLLWYPYAHTVATSGLPTSPALDQPIPAPALVIAIVSVAGMSLLTGLMGARRAMRAELVDGASISGAFRRTSVGIVRKLLCVVASLGVGALYYAIAQVEPLQNIDEMGGMLGAYVGVGVLLSVVVALWGPYILRVLVEMLRVLPITATPWFLAVREAQARPTLTGTLIMPIAIAASTTGMAGMSISKFRQVLVSMGVPDSESLSAPLSISLLLVGGSIVVACASAASVVLIALRPRQHDAQLLYTSGATDELLTQKNSDGNPGVPHSCWDHRLRDGDHQRRVHDVRVRARAAAHDAAQHARRKYARRPLSRHRHCRHHALEHYPHRTPPQHHRKDTQPCCSKRLTCTNNTTTCRCCEA